MSNYEIHVHNKNFPFVVFLHGWGQSKMMMSPLASCIEDCANTINFDLPGFGECPLPRPFSIKDYVQYIHHILKLENIRPALIIGHSFGGKIATYYALKYPVKLLLLAPSIMRPRFRLQVFLKIKAYKMYRYLLKHRIIKKIPPRYQGSADLRNTSGDLRRTFQQIVHAFPNKDIAKLKKSTIILWGDEDREIDYYQMKKMKKYLKNGQVITIKGDHFAYLSRRKSIGRIIKNILAEDAQ